MSRTRTYGARLALAVLPLLLPAMLHGQQDAPAPAATAPAATDADEVVSPRPLPRAASSTSPWTSEALADRPEDLNVISIIREPLYTTSLAVGYGRDSAINNVSGQAANFSQIEGTLDINLRKRDYTLLLQHDARFSRFNYAGQGLQTFQQTDATASGYFDRVTKWTAHIDNGFGDDSARTVGDAPDNTGGSPLLTDLPNQLGLTQGKTLNDFASFDVQHRFSGRLLGEATASQYFHHFFSNGTSGQQQTVSATLKRYWSRTTITGLQLSGTHQSYGDAHCSTASVLVVASMQPTRDLWFEGSAGPSLSTSECSGRYVANGLVSAHAFRDGVVFVGASRKPSDQFVAGSNWESSAYGGLSFGEPRRVRLRFDAGYARYTGVQNIAVTPNLQGYFCSGDLRHRLSNTSEISFTSRYFNQDSSSARLNRTIFLVNFIWSREQHTRRASNFGGLDGDR